MKTARIIKKVIYEDVEVADDATHFLCSRHGTLLEKIFIDPKVEFAVLIDCDGEKVGFSKDARRALYSLLKEIGVEK